MTNRICGMLARQGTAIGVLYELTWRNHNYNDTTREEFASVVASPDCVVSKILSRAGNISGTISYQQETRN